MPPVEEELKEDGDDGRSCYVRTRKEGRQLMSHWAATILETDYGDEQAVTLFFFSLIS